MSMPTSDNNSVELKEEKMAENVEESAHNSEYLEPENSQITDHEANFDENDLCQHLTETLSVSSMLTHTLTPIPSLTDKTISISRNTNSLTWYNEEGSEDNEGNVKLTNWTTRSFYTSTEDMISSGVFDSDIEASGNDEFKKTDVEESTATTNEDSAYKWQDISTSDLPDDEDETYVPYRKPRENVESSIEDEQERPRRPHFFSIRRSERSDNSYPSSGNRTYLCSESSDLVTREDEVSSIKTSVPSISTMTPMVSSGFNDTAAATGSSIFSDPSDTEGVYDGIIQGNENVEHNLIASRYGLPHDMVRCRCHVEAQKTQRGHNLDIVVCKSGSCHKFKDEFGEVDGGSFRDCRGIKRSNGFKKAYRVYKDFITKPEPSMRRAFRKADYKLKVKYPYFWVYLSEKFKTFISDEHYQQENACKEEVVESCQRLLKEQCFFSQHYQMTVRDPGHDVKFSVDFCKLHDDFLLACEFLMKEYPSLFQYLIKKYGFEKFAETRLRVDVNRKKVIACAKKSQAELDELNDKYYHKSLEEIKKKRKSR